MKLIKRICLTFLSAMFLCTGLISCGGDGDKKPTAKNIVLADFERFEPDFQLLRISTYFGAVNVNKDMQYVKSGKTSAKVQPLGRWQTESKPLMYFPLVSSRFEYDYSDFSYYDGVALWIYNAQSENIPVEIGFVEKMIDINEVATISGETWTLSSGWNRIVYYPDLDSLNLTCDIFNLYGVYLRFPNTPSTELEDAPVFYVDDVILKVAPKKQDIKELVQLEENEILFFDKDWQQNIIISNPAHENAIPEVSVVKASEEGIVSAPNGATENCILKLVTKPCSESGWPSIEIPSKVIDKSGVADIERANRGKYELCFDVYSKDLDTYLYPDFGVSMWSNWHATNVYVSQGEWTTYRYNLSLVPTSIYSGFCGFRVSWPEYASGGERTYYFDNFRIEYIGD